MSEYPEHYKMLACTEERNAVGDFLDWLQEQQYVIAEQEQGSWRNLVRVRNSIEDWLALYLGIDMEKIEAEKRQMLVEVRRNN
jgi:hypothetical protein